MPGTSTAALQAKFNARELERAAIETKAKNERAAEAAAIRQAVADDAVAAAQAAAAANRYEVDTPMEAARPAGVSSG